MRKHVKISTRENDYQLIKDLGDVVDFVYLLIDLFTIFDTADVETPVFLAISAMGIPYSEKSLIAIRNRTKSIIY